MELQSGDVTIMVVLIASPRIEGQLFHASRSNFKLHLKKRPINVELREKSLMEPFANAILSNPMGNGKVIIFGTIINFPHREKHKTWSKA